MPKPTVDAEERSFGDFFKAAEKGIGHFFSSGVSNLGGGMIGSAGLAAGAVKGVPQGIAAAVETKNPMDILVVTEESALEAGEKAHGYAQIGDHKQHSAQ
eukprot:EC120015.1.p2 GENE.EC120015.1~~EC120015.1.p2  ORF type:complete len:100 (+),score=19.53 EC120015.1:124-423(+)